MEDQTPITIRHMQIGDVEQVVQIDQLSFTLPWPRSSFRYEVTENKASRLWVTEVIKAGQPVLAAMLVCWIILDEAHIGTIAVHPDYRRQKIAEQMMTRAFEELKNEGVKQVFLEVRRSNEAALTLYRKMGFIEDGIRKRYYKDNQEDAILMELPDLGTFFQQEHDNGSI
jgi:ribosomal-protein-alanine N-acetyltransferase